MCVPRREATRRAIDRHDQGKGRGRMNAHRTKAEVALERIRRIERYAFYNEPGFYQEAAEQFETAFAKLRARLKQRIRLWGKEREKAMAIPPDPPRVAMCACYVDAYQSVYTSCFGEKYEEVGGENEKS